jgi:UDP-GlcNAc3NAcA epimerase
MKIVTVVGARPQFIKAAAVSRVLSESGIDEILVHTGQHYDAEMSDVFFEQMGIPEPAHHLGVGGGLHGAMTGRQLEKIEDVLVLEKPDWVLVYGDTNSTLAGALAAAKLHIPVAHVEAGLRSFNRRMPEEINRILTDHLSALLFAPTDAAIANLAREGILGGHVRRVGDVMLDATLFYKPRALEPEWFGALGVGRKEYVLCTIHRAENTDDPCRLESIIEGLSACGLPVVFPAHPRTRRALEAGSATVGRNIHMVPPVGYLQMTWLEMHAKVVATDSGGVQKEAYFHRKPCVTLRDETEWVELVEHGFNTVAGADAARIAGAIGSAEFPDRDPSLYGSGRSADAICRSLRDFAVAAPGMS